MLQADREAPPVLTVVLATRNGEAFIGGQLKALDHQRWDCPWELVVVDNGSTDQTVDILQYWAADRPWVRLVQAPSIPSPGYARNVGIGIARGQYVAFVDDDDVVGDGWLSHLGDAVLADQYVGARLDTRLLNDETARTARQPAQQERIDRFHGAPVIATSLLAVRRDWLLAVGGFDESIGLEDTDLCLRLYERYGSEPVFCADAVYHYRLRSDVRGTFRQGFRYGMYQPYLIRRWRHLLPDPPQADVPGALRDWFRLVVAAPLGLVHPVRRLSWARRVGSRVGRLVGSVRFRTLLP